MKAKLSPDQAKQFILAGNALITIKSMRTSKHFTYKIKKHKTKDVWFISIAYNGGDRLYHYIGCILANHQFKHTKASRVKPNSDSFTAFSWSWNNLQSNQIEIWHEGKCGRCGRLLTEPKSIEQGFGPHCYSLLYNN